MSGAPGPIERVKAALGLSRVRRHIFLCADQTDPKCCAKEDGLAAWERLKAGIAEKGLDRDIDGGGRVILRTKANCLRVCQQGPVAVVWPDGIWYKNVTAEAVDRIIDEHLIGGVPVAEYVLAAPEAGGD